MKIGAVICELNPFHDGHKYIFETAKKDCDIVIAVMSGNYVQRGECAVFNKYKRAEQAVNGYADLCVEIPFPFSSTSAEYFAKYGVYIAQKLRADSLYFGSECADKEAILRAAEILDSPDYVSALKEGRAAEIRERFLKERFHDIPDSILSSPNDILATEYARNADIELVPIKRIDTKSATEIRKEVCENNRAEARYSDLLKLIFDNLKTKNAPDFSTAESSSGIINRAINVAGETNSYEEFIQLLNTKQYTESRIKRTLLFYLFGVLDSDIKTYPEFTNVLAMNEKGKEYVSALRKQDTGLALLTSYSDSSRLSKEGKRQFELVSFADRIYTSLANYNDASYFVKKHTIIV